MTVSAPPGDADDHAQLDECDGRRNRDGDDCQRSGECRDWVGLHRDSAADAAYGDWKYLNGTQSRPASGMTGAAVAFTMPATPGTYNVRFFLNDSWTKLATSATITVTAAAPPSITLSATTVAPGGTVTATIANGPGYAGDWIGLYGASVADATSYVDWKYLNGTQSTGRGAV